MRAGAARDLPSGTIAFLFTDIEGSTKRWEAYADAMKAAVRTHDAVLRSAIERHGGSVFKTVGDAFCAAFPTVDGALVASCEAQRELASHDWSAIDGLRVRMAIHAGAADERDHDYFGPPVNRVARLLAIGHGGQILVSGVARQLASALDARELSFEDLGAHPLKDLTEPERVFQLCGPGLTREFRALAVTRSAPGNMPRLTSTFVGRRGAAQQLGDLVASGGLTTITGTGGVGKTRMALHVAERAADTPDGRWYVELAPLRDPALVAGEILTIVDRAPHDRGSSLDALVSLLRDRRALLLLDNCEHLIDEVARIAAAIVTGCPGITLVATSRERLGIDGEKLFRLAPLDVADAIELFVERARGVNPLFALTADNEPTIAEICRRVDGIALAIELAAARLRVMSVAELSRHLNERFRVLTGGNRTAMPRHQTMRALIDWSYDALGEDERRVFRRLAAFTGGCTLDAASAVIGDARTDTFAIVDLLAKLVDKSLVVAEIEAPDARYSLLSSIEEYARERLVEHGEAETLARAHAAHVASIAQRAYRQWDTSPASRWFDDVAPDVDNVRAALTWALGARNDVALGVGIIADIAPALMRLAPAAEVIAWCERAAAVDVATARQRMQLSYALSMLYNNAASYSQALSAVETAAACSEVASDVRARVRILSQLAQQRANAGRHDDARELAREALDAARALGDRALLGATLQRCATVFPPSDLAAARTQFAEAVALFESLERPLDAARVLVFWGTAELRAGRYDDAIAVNLRAQAIGNPDLALYLANNIAVCAVAAGRDELARSAARDALALAVMSGHETIALNALIHLAAATIDEDPERAARLIAYAAARRAALGYAADEIDAIVAKRCADRLGAVLSDADSARLRDEGSALTSEQAVAIGRAI